MFKRKLKVLIVDDSDTIKKRIRAMLKEIPDVTVIGEAGNGTEALVITEIMKPDVMLLDLYMPVLNGIEVLREVKKNFKGTQVIILTNYSDDQHRDKCLKAGAEYFFDKSIEFEKVPEVLANMANSLRN